MYTIAAGIDSTPAPAEKKALLYKNNQKF